jgi:hypothetical protein
MIWIDTVRFNNLRKKDSDHLMCLTRVDGPVHHLRTHGWKKNCGSTNPGIAEIQLSVAQYFAAAAPAPTKRMQKIEAYIYIIYIIDIAVAGHWLANLQLDCKRYQCRLMIVLTRLTRLHSKDCPHAVFFKWFGVRRDLRHASRWWTATCEWFRWATESKWQQEAHLVI